MNYRELLYNKDNVLSFYPELAVILNKYERLEWEKKVSKKVKDSEDKDEKKPRLDMSGLNKAIIINQINYWNDINEKTNNNFKDGYYWVYNTYETWVENDFPYWSVDTVKRAITALENIGIVVSANYNRMKIDKTKWYRIDYDRLQEIIDIVKKSEEEQEEYEEKPNKKQSAPTDGAYCGYDGANCPDGRGNSIRTITRDYNREYLTENNNTKNTKNNSTLSELDEHTKQTKQLSYEQRRDMMFGMIPRARKICVDELGYSDTITWNVQNCIDYFLKMHCAYTGNLHPTLKNETLKEIIITFTEEHSDEYNHTINALVTEDKSDTRYREIINEYFNTKFTEKTNYNLSHFASDGVLKNLLMHHGEYL